MVDHQAEGGMIEEEIAGLQDALDRMRRKHGELKAERARWKEREAELSKERDETAAERNRLGILACERGDEIEDLEATVERLRRERDEARDVSPKASWEYLAEADGLQDAFDRLSRQKDAITAERDAALKRADQLQHDLDLTKVSLANRRAIQDRLTEALRRTAAIIVKEGCCDGCSTDAGHHEPSCYISRALGLAGIDARPDAPPPSPADIRARVAEAANDTARAASQPMQNKARPDASCPPEPTKGASGDGTMKRLTIRKMQRKAHATALEKGWWDKAPNYQEHPDGMDQREVDCFAAKLALIHSEVSEALEALRETGAPNVTFWDSNGAKPVGVGIELADVLIRIGDLCERYGIDLEAAVVEKLRFNKTRPMRHGNKHL